jgi:hypothetical protein
MNARPILHARRSSRSSAATHRILAVRCGDIDCRALNHAVFRDYSELAAFLLAQGSHYDERHG